MKHGKHLIPAASALALHIALLGFVASLLPGNPGPSMTSPVEVSLLSPPLRPPSPPVQAQAQPAKVSPPLAPLPKRVVKPLPKPEPATLEATPDAPPLIAPPLAAPPVAVPSPPAGPAQPVPAAVRTGISGNAVVTAGTPPVFPAFSQRNCEFGTVNLWIYVSTDGRPEKVEFKQRSSYPSLDESALKAVRAWRFKPELVDGKPTAAWYQQTILFKKPENC